jgi:quercetin dioxygenase-like cupin family protein
MTTRPQTIAAAEALTLHMLVTPTKQGIASRVLARTAGGNLTLFAFDAGQELTEHTSPFDASVIVLEGSPALTIDGKELTATPGTIVRMPSSVPHAVRAPEPARMLLVMFREQAERQNEQRANIPAEWILVACPSPIKKVV